MESNEEGTHIHTKNRPSSRTNKDSKRKGLLALCFLGLLGALLLLFLKAFVDEEKLENSCEKEKDQLKATYSTVVEERDELQTRVSKLESMLEIKSCAVDVSLDPDTAYPGLILSADGKQMRRTYEDVLQDLPKNTERFDSVSCAMGKEGFSSGKFYFEVEVTGTTDADLGVASHSVNRKGEITVSPEDGFWELWLRNGTEYEAILNNKNVPLSLEEAPQVVGVFVDYEAGLVSFYDAYTWHRIYSFTSASFTTEIHPSLCINAFNETLAFKTKCH